MTKIEGEGRRRGCKWNWICVGLCLCVCVQSPAVECWVGKKISVARLEPIRKGGLKDMKGQKKTEKKDILTKEERGKVRSVRRSLGRGREEWRGCRSLSWLSLASAGVKELRFNVYEVLENWRSVEVWCLDYGINVTQTCSVPQKITYSILFVCLFFLSFVLFFTWK